MATGIKETMDVLAGLDSVASALLKAASDGKLNLLDIRHVLDPVKAAGEALKGAQLIPSEIKDLDGAEVEALLVKASTLLPRLVEAVAALVAVVGK